MLEHKLMADGNHRRTFASRDGVERGHRLEEIDDDVRLSFANDFIQLAQDAEIFWQFAKDAEERGGVADGTIIFVFEFQRRQLPDFNLHRRCEVFRHRSLRARAERHRDDLMSRRLGHFLDGHRLRQVTPALAQHAEHYFHGSG